MANKKPRTPTPPRNQGPRQRTDARSGPPLDLGLRHRAVLYGVAAAGIVGLVVVVLVIVLSGGSTNDKTVAADFTAAGCTFKTVKAYVPKGENVHVQSLTKKFPWNTTPPSNGQHYPLWSVWGFYTEAVNPRQVVHNEEHGGVIEWWGSQVSQATVAKLKAFYDEHPDGGFGTPYPSLGSKIALTAWTGNVSDYGHNNYYGFGHIAVCSTYTAATKKAFEAFRKAYIGKGPEGIPLSADEPGMGPTQ